ncbi:MAG: redoxin domain-containing protein [Fimbriimonadales bacterium]
MLKRISTAVLILAVAAIAVGQPKPAVNQSELQKLEAAYNQAINEYYKPFESAHSQEEMAKIKLDPKKDPNPVYLAKFREFAESAGTTQDAFQAWMMVKQLGENSGNAKAVDEASDVIMTKFIDSPWIGQFASALPYSGWALPQDQREKKIGGMLTKMEDLAKTPAVKATAMYARAQLISREGQGDTVGAAKLYHEVLEKYPGTPEAKRAKGDIFETENLVVGKPAPEMLATDQDGVKFKLSDYRGKVVVLDFWGFW